MIPYAVQIDYYFAACGQTRTGVDGKTIDTMDNWTVRADGTVVAGADGVQEIVLFSDTNSKPGNFGSLDIGSSSNGTPELDRQILYGPTVEDFQNSDFANKVAAAGGEQLLDQDRVVERLSQDSIVNALAEIPHDFRDVVVLVDIGDFTYADAAQILDIPMGTVMSRLHRGRRLLKARLAEEAVQ